MFSVKKAELERSGEGERNIKEQLEASLGEKEERLSVTDKVRLVRRSCEEECIEK